MSNPSNAAIDALEQCKLQDRVKITVGEMLTGMWVVGFRPVEGTAPLGGLTNILWRVSEQRTWAGVPGCPSIYTVEDYRFAPTTPEETAQLDALLNAVRDHIMMRKP